MDRVWQRLVLTLYPFEKKVPVSSPQVVLKSRKFEVSYDKNDTPVSGRIEDFFPLMGDFDTINSVEGRKKTYILCWHDDDDDPDFFHSQRKLVSIRFNKGFDVKKDERGKLSYNCEFMI